MTTFSSRWFFYVAICLTSSISINIWLIILIHLWLFRDCLFNLYRHLVSECVAQRRSDVQRKKRQYITSGSNYVWFVDDHDKLKEFEFEIYAEIDAYSRYIIWFYVEIFARTAVSALTSYLNAILFQKAHLRYIRSDRDTKTMLMTDAHHQICQEIISNIEFKYCYMYEINTVNQRIESWWQQLTMSYLNRWIVSNHRVLSWFTLLTVY